MSANQAKEIARRFLEEAFLTGDFTDLLTPDYQDHNAPPGTQAGPEGVRRLTEPYRQAFPDLRMTVEDQTVEGDKVVTRWVFAGTQTGELMGMPPTGRRVRMEGISIYRIVDGKMQEAWVQYDLFGLLQQLGAIPAPGAAVS